MKEVNKRPNTFREDTEENSEKKRKIKKKLILNDKIIDNILDYATSKINGLRVFTDFKTMTTLDRVSKGFHQRIRKGGYDPKLFEERKEFSLDQMYELGIKDNFEEIDYVAEDVLANFSSKEYAYVGLGRSFSPILGQLLRREPSSVVINLPLGSLGQGLEKEWAKHLESVETCTRIFGHFDEFVHQNKLRGRKKVLLLDYASSGRALYVVSKWLNAYYQGTVEVKAYAIAGEDATLLDKFDVRVADREKTNLLAISLFGGDLKKANIDLFDSFKWQDLYEGKQHSGTAELKNFYRLLKLLKDAEDASKNK